MAPNETIIEFESVKKGRKLIFYILIGVLAATSILFAILWIVKPQGNRVGVNSIEVSNNFLVESYDNEGKEIYSAALGNKYTLSAHMETVGNISPVVKWTVSPANSVTLVSLDENNSQVEFLVPVTASAKDRITITAQSSYNENVKTQFTFTVKEYYAVDSNVITFSNSNSSFPITREEGNIFNISVPYVENNASLNLFTLNVEQLGILGEGGQRAPITQGKILNGKNTNKIKFNSSLNLSVTELSNLESASVTVEKAGSHSMTYELNTYAGSDEYQPITYTVNITAVSITENTSVLSSIGFKKDSYDIFNADASKSTWYNFNNDIVFSHANPKGGSWAYKIFESDSIGKAVTSASSLLYVEGTQVGSTGRAIGATYLTIQDTAGYGVFSTVKIRVVNSLTSMSFGTASGIKKAGESFTPITVTFGLKAVQTEKLTVDTTPNISLLVNYGSLAVKPPSDFDSNSAAASTSEYLYIKGMKYNSLYSTFEVPLSNVVLSQDGKTISGTFVISAGATVTASAYGESYKLTFTAAAQSASGVNQFSSITYSASVSDVVETVNLKTPDSETTKIVTKESYDEGTRYFNVSSAEEGFTYYLFKPTGSNGTSFTIFDLLEFKNLAGNSVILTASNFSSFSDHVKFESEGSALNSNYTINNSTIATKKKITVSVNNVLQCTLIINYVKTLKSVTIDTSASTPQIAYSNSNAANYSIEINSNDTFTTTYYDVPSTPAMTVQNMYSYVRINNGSANIMLDFHIIGDNTYFYYDADDYDSLKTDNENIAAAIFVRNNISGKIYLNYDLFAYSFNRSDSALTPINSINILYSPYPLRNAGGYPEIDITAKNADLYTGLTYDGIRLSLTSSKNYTFIRYFDDSAFYSGNDYETKITSLGTNISSAFTLYPSGIITYKDAGGSTKNIVVNNSAYKTLISGITMETLPAEITIPLNAKNYIIKQTGYTYNANKTGEYIMSFKINNGNEPAVTVKVQNDAIAISGIRLFSDSAKNKEITLNQIVPLYNSHAEGTTKYSNKFTVYLSVSYDSYNGLYTKYSPFFVDLDTNGYLSYVITNEIVPESESTSGTDTIGTIADFDGTPMTIYYETAYVTFTAKTPAAGTDPASINGKTEIKIWNGLTGTSGTEIAKIFDIDVITRTKAVRLTDSGTGNQHTGAVIMKMTAGSGGSLVNVSKVFNYDFIAEDSSINNNSGRTTTLTHTIQSGETGNFSVSINSSARTITLTTNGKTYKSTDPLVITFKITENHYVLQSDGSYTYESLEIEFTINVEVQAELYDVNLLVDDAESQNKINLVTTGANSDVASKNFAVLKNGEKLSEDKSSIVSSNNSNNIVGSFTYELSYSGITEDKVTAMGLKVDKNINTNSVYGFTVSVNNNCLKPPDGARFSILISYLIDDILIEKEIPISITTKDVQIEFTNFNESLNYIKEGDAIVINKFDNVSMDFGISAYNAWDENKAQQVSISGYTVEYKKPSYPDGRDPDTVDIYWGTVDKHILNIGNSVSSITFSISADFYVDSNQYHTIKANIRLYNKVENIAVTKRLYGQTSDFTNEIVNPASDTIKINLVKNFKFDIKEFITLTGVDGITPWTQEFSLTVDDVNDGKIEISDATKIEALEKTEDGSPVLIDIIAKLHETQIASGETAVTRRLEITVIEPFLSAEFTNAAVVNNKNVLNVINIGSTLNVKFNIDESSLNYKTVNSVSDANVKINSNIFGVSAITKGGSVYTCSISFDKSKITFSDIDKEYTVTISIRVDGVEITETLKFTLIASLGDLTNNLEIEVSTATNNSIDTSIADITHKAAVKDSGNLIAALLSEYGESATVRYYLSANELEGVSIGETNGTLIFPRGITGIVKIYAVFSIYGKTFTFTDNSNNTKYYELTFKNTSNLSTRYYVTTIGSLYDDEAETFDENDSIAVDYDGTNSAKQKMIYVLVDYSKYNYDFTSIDSFTPYVSNTSNLSGAILTPHKVDNVNYKGIDTDNKVFYAAYKINGTGTSLIGGSVSQYGLTHSAAPLELEFTATRPDGTGENNLLSFVQSLSLQPDGDIVTRNSYIKSVEGNNFKGNYTVSYLPLNAPDYVSGTSYSPSFASFTWNSDGTFTVTPTKPSGSVTSTGGKVSFKVTITITSGIFNTFEYTSMFEVVVASYVKPEFTAGEKTIAARDIGNYTETVTIDHSGKIVENAEDGEEYELLHISLQNDWIKSLYSYVDSLSGYGSLDFGSKYKLSINIITPDKNPVRKAIIEADSSVTDFYFSTESNFYLISIRIDFIGGIWAGTNSAYIEIKLYVEPDLTAAINFSTSGIKGEARDYVTLNETLMFTPLINDFVKNNVTYSYKLAPTPLGYLNGDNKFIPAYSVANKGGRVYVDITAVISGDYTTEGSTPITKQHSLSGRIYSVTISFDVTSMQLKDETFGTNSVYNSKIYITPDTNIDVSSITLPSFIGNDNPLGDAAFVSAQLVNGLYDNARLSLDNKLLKCAPGSNFTGSDITYESAIMITATINGKRVVNYFDIVIKRQEAPVITYSISYLDSISGESETASDGMTINVGESLIIDFDVTNSNYVISNLVINVNSESANAVAISISGYRATVTALKAADTVELTLGVQIYGVIYPITLDGDLDTFAFGIKAISTSEFSLDVKTTELVNNAMSYIKLTQSEAKNYSAFKITVKPTSGYFDTIKLYTDIGATSSREIKSVTYSDSNGVFYITGTTELNSSVYIGFATKNDFTSGTAIIEIDIAYKLQSDNIEKYTTKINTIMTYLTNANCETLFPTLFNLKSANQVKAYYRNNISDKVYVTVDTSKYSMSDANTQVALAVGKTGYNPNHFILENNYLSISLAGRGEADVLTASLNVSVALPNQYSTGGAAKTFGYTTNSASFYPPVRITFYDTEIKGDTKVQTHKIKSITENFNESVFSTIVFSLVGSSDGDIAVIDNQGTDGFTLTPNSPLGGYVTVKAAITIGTGSTNYTNQTYEYEEIIYVDPSPTPRLSHTIADNTITMAVKDINNNNISNSKSFALADINGNSLDIETDEDSLQTNEYLSINVDTGEFSYMPTRKTTVQNILVTITINSGIYKDKTFTYLVQINITPVGSDPEVVATYSGEASKLTYSIEHKAQVTNGDTVLPLNVTYTFDYITGGANILSLETNNNISTLKVKPVSSSTVIVIKITATVTEGDYKNEKAVDVIVIYIEPTLTITAGTEGNITLNMPTNDGTPFTSYNVTSLGSYTNILVTTTNNSSLITYKYNTLSNTITAVQVRITITSGIYNGITVDSNTVNITTPLIKSSFYMYYGGTSGSHILRLDVYKNSVAVTNTTNNGGVKVVSLTSNNTSSGITFTPNSTAPLSVDVTNSWSTSSHTLTLTVNYGTMYPNFQNVSYSLGTYTPSNLTGVGVTKTLV